MDIFKKVMFLLAFASLLTGATACQKDKQETPAYHVDQQYVESILGEYQVMEEDVEGDEYVGSWWHLTVIRQEENEFYMSIYDNAAGNPGIEGKIVSLDSESIVMEYDPDYYDQLPSALWKVEGKNLIMNYEVTDTGIKLTNGNKTLTFEKEEMDDI